jgi:Skp family chaperone for outer membrane proteins
MYTEELRRKTTEELQGFLNSLHLYHQKMHEQANYWLDAKEQLIMDAETHNKVIASLVQYAQQQQQQVPKGILVEF